LVPFLFRIAQTLYKQNTARKFLETQTDAIRIGFGVILFAFVVSACVGVASTPAPSATNTPFAPIPALVIPTTDPLAPTPAPQIFDGKHAYDEYLISQMNFGIRPPGSKALRATGDYIIAELKKRGWQVETQEFVYRGVPIRNVIGKFGAGQGPQAVTPSAECTRGVTACGAIILGAHYDTRPRANMDKTNPSAPVPGANDGASGVAVLLELARSLDKAKLKNEIYLAFFDAEDNGGLSACDLRIVEMQTVAPACDTTEWTWSIGAEHVAENLVTKPAAVIVVDMIGDADQNIHYERNSDKELQQGLWKIAEQLGYRQWFIPEDRWSMTDDHTPFLKRGIRAIDIIDFDYPPWHTTGDTADKVSAASLERVGRVLEVWVEGR